MSDQHGTIAAMTDHTANLTEQANLIDMAVEHHTRLCDTQAAMIFDAFAAGLTDDEIASASKLAPALIERRRNQWTQTTDEGRAWLESTRETVDA